MISGGPEPLRLSREVLAALLFGGGRVYPSCPFAFLEQTPRADAPVVTRETGSVDGSELERALDVLRRPDRALIALTWGGDAQRRTPFVGRNGSFVLAFAEPSGDCLISLPVAGERMIELLMVEVGWAQNPTLGQVRIEELPTERFDVFSLQILDDAPPTDVRTMTRAAFAGPAGRRVMVVPVQESDEVEVVALEQRDLRASASLLLGLPPPPPHPPPDLVVDLAVHLRECSEAHTIYAFEDRVVAHSLTAAGYTADHLERDGLRNHVMKIAHLSDAPARPERAPTFSAKAASLENWDQADLPEEMADLLRARHALFSATVTTREGEQIAMTEIVWIDTGQEGLWRVELSEDRVTLEQTASASLTAELLPSSN